VVNILLNLKGMVGVRQIGQSSNQKSLKDEGKRVN